MDKLTSILQVMGELGEEHYLVLRTDGSGKLKTDDKVLFTFSTLDECNSKICGYQQYLVILDRMYEKSSNL